MYCRYLRIQIDGALISEVQLEFQDTLSKSLENKLVFSTSTKPVLLSIAPVIPRVLLNEMRKAKKATKVEGRLKFPLRPFRLSRSGIYRRQNASYQCSES